MKQIVTTGIVLSRTDYQEADRILTILTPDQGKVRALAKGVRRAKSKLAGGIELLSVSDITYAPGRGELGTLISARMQIHYGQIVTDINRTMLAYELIKIINKVTEDPAGQEYFDLLKGTLIGLDSLAVTQELVQMWFYAQLLKITGQAPNLQTDSTGEAFQAEARYLFSFEEMAFMRLEDGPIPANGIKLLRLAYAVQSPVMLGNVQDAPQLAGEAIRILRPVVYSSFGL